MKRLTLGIIAVLLMFVIVGCAGVEFASATTLNYNGCDCARALSPAAQNVLNYLKALPYNGNKDRVISGQFAGYASGACYEFQGVNNECNCKSRDDTFSISYERLVTDLYKNTGKYVAMVGADYGFSANEQRIEANLRLKKHLENRGYVTISWHSKNPWNGEVKKDCSDGTPTWTENDIDSLKELADKLCAEDYTGIAATWKQYLDDIAAGLKDFGNHVVLWRPFHEMNGCWFWWGLDGEAFKKVWKHMFCYFTQEHGLNNLLWVFAVNDTPIIDLEAYYPGDSYVDVVGIDVYGSLETLQSYTPLTSLKKPMGLIEYGGLNADPCNPGSNHSNQYIIDMIKQKYQLITFFQFWHLPWAIAGNTGASALLDDAWVVTLNACVFVEPGGVCEGRIDCYASIQEAINAAKTGDILISEGTYHESITLNGPKSLTLKGGCNSSYNMQSSNKTFINAPKATQGSLTLQMLTIQPQ